MQLTSTSVAVVTGAASGLGEATTRRLVAAGPKVVMADPPGPVPHTHLDVYKRQALHRAASA